MVKVYFESKHHADLVAEFDTEELYNLCRPSLVAEASKHRMIVTESIDNDDFDLKEFSDWILDGNVVKNGEENYREQSTQWNVQFTFEQLKDFYINEFGND
tara:strand:- start:5595 stop:5897 length:303 start_codon:yes stop_codon:yes gene_type:complete